MGAALSNSGLALSALCTVIGLGAWAVLWSLAHFVQGRTDMWTSMTPMT